MKKIGLFVLVVACAISCRSPLPEVRDSRLVVYPNPATEFAYINVNNQGVPFVLKVFNFDGKLALYSTSTQQQQSGEYQVTLPDEGTYYVVLEIDNKMIKQTILRPAK